MQASWHAVTDSKSSGRLRTLVAYHIKRIDDFQGQAFNSSLLYSMRLPYRSVSLREGRFGRVAYSNALGRPAYVHIAVGANCFDKVRGSCDFSVV